MVMNEQAKPDSGVVTPAAGAAVTATSATVSPHPLKMPPGPRAHRQASLRVAITEGVPSEMQAHIRELVSLKSGNPRKGDATGLMWAVCAEADLARMMLLLRAEPFSGDITQAQLEKFYQRFGFVKIQATPVLMARSPEKPPRDMLFESQVQREAGKLCDTIDAQVFNDVMARSPRKPLIVRRH